MTVMAIGENATELLYLTDAYRREFEATVVAVDGNRVALDATLFYVTGGGQPHDTGVIEEARVLDVTKDGAVAWHVLDGPLPLLGAIVRGSIDWDRRHQLMRTHTALHILCGVIWNEYGKAVTGGNMEPLAARMDFEFDPLPEGFAGTIERRVNEEIGRDRPIVVSFLSPDAVISDEALIRTKTNMVPTHVREVRVVDIVGLDKQADGGTHVRSTSEVGHVRVVKTESKGKGNKRVRIAVE
jgi:misacylated tRNA(Ala) deacylase